MFKRTLAALSLLLIFSHSFSQKILSSVELAPTPPMGWNSYNCYGATVTEAEVKANADYIAKNLKKYGWNYVIIDYVWWYPHPPNSSQNNPPQFRLPKDGSLVPYFLMDAYGRLQPDTRRFPSSAGGKGFKALADYVHGLGLKFGIHVMRGIPRQAVWYNTPVMGRPEIKAQDIVDTTSKCGWLNNMWGVNTEKPGAQEYYNSLLQLYASWGVDFIKLDDMQSIKYESYHASEIEAFSKAIEKTNKPIVFSVSPKIGMENTDHVKKYAQMWRVSDDFWDTWEQIEEQFILFKNFIKYAEPGKYPDGDMLQLGKLAKRGPVGKERFTGFTQEEQKTHMSLWCITKSPLMFGGNLPENDSYTLSLISNPEVIALNQKAQKPKEVYDVNKKTVWMSTNSDKTVNVGLFNRTEKPEEIEVKLADLGLDANKTYLLRDLWSKKDIGTIKGSFIQNIHSHGSGLYSIR
jgi:alpha-galactosidase